MVLKGEVLDIGLKHSSKTKVMQFEAVFVFDSLRGQNHYFLTGVAGKNSVFVIGTAGYEISCAWGKLVLLKIVSITVFYGSIKRG